MNSKTVIITLSLVLVLCVTIAYSKGGKGGGRGRGSSGRGSSKSKPRPADSYPKQPLYNPNYNPSAPYPKQPGQQPGYPGQQHNYPGQHGIGSYPGQSKGMGGLGTGLGTGFGGKSKGMGGLGAGLAGGALGAAVGAYGSYKLGQMVGGLGRFGHYGYYDDHSYRYVRCDPPPKIETDPETNITYIPKTITYDARCQYYDKEPPRMHPYYSLYVQYNQTTTVDNINLNETKQNETDLIAPSQLNETEYNSLNNSLLDNKSRNDSIETNTRGLAVNTSAIPVVTTTVIEDSTELLAQNKTIMKSMNRRSVTKIYGYFSTDGSFNYCEETSKKGKGGSTTGDDKKDETVWLCQYFDGEELKKKFNRRIESKNRFNGVFGYYYFGKFKTCAPPDRLEDDPNRTDIKYIPFDLNYNPDCHYFDNDPGQKWDYSWIP